MIAKYINNKLHQWRQAKRSVATEKTQNKSCTASEESDTRCKKAGEYYSTSSIQIRNLLSTGEIYSIDMISDLRDAFEASTWTVEPWEIALLGSSPTTADVCGAYWEFHIRPHVLVGERAYMGRCLLGG